MLAVDDKLLSLIAKMVPQERFRTPDPIITNDVLYQLSYCGLADQRRAGGAFRIEPLSMPVFPLLAIRPNAVARASSR